MASLASDPELGHCRIERIRGFIVAWLGQRRVTNKAVGVPAHELVWTVWRLQKYIMARDEALRLQVPDDGRGAQLTPSGARNPIGLIVM